ncbi:transglutaminase domain-containing protein [Bilifractor sp. LCP21S3_A7]|uniref:transglutaminase domain-containing protein n=1 Tax=Bilifractor sp. LCP21S3_A7 TaxID=3438738 RepID=UPI003F8FCF9A
MKRKRFVQLLAVVTAAATLFTASPVFAADANGSVGAGTIEGASDTATNSSSTAENGAAESKTTTVTSAGSETAGSSSSGSTDTTETGSPAAENKNSGDNAAESTVMTASKESESAEADSASDSSETKDTSEESEEEKKETEEKDDKDDTQEIPVVSYAAHVQQKGWPAEDTVSGTDAPTFAGFTGKRLRVEAIRASVKGDQNLGITYNTYVQRKGWTGSQSDGAVAGTTGQSLRVEAIVMELTGTDADKYDLYYRVHVQSFGWLAWAKNGEVAGTTNLSRRIEAYEVAIVKKGEAAPERSAARNVAYLTVPTVTYQTHVQRYGWSQGEVSNGALSGTTGQGLRMEALKIHLGNTTGFTGGISYCSHIQRLGWEQNWKSDGVMTGTEGKGLRLEAIRIRLTGEMANCFDVYYRTHVQRFGWTGWASNGADCGSAGYGYRLEAIEIRIVAKGWGAPGSTANTFHQYTIRDTYPQACARLDQVGWNLRSALNAAAGLRYVSTSYALTASNVSTIASYGFTTGRGDCYVMACCFYEMAKALGYDAHVMFGYVPLRSEGLGVHSWVEIDNYQGGTGVFDPDFQHESGSDGFNLYYGKPGTWRYTSGSRIN